MKLKQLTLGALSVALLAGCAGNKQDRKVTAANGSTLSVGTIFAPPDMNGNRYADTHLRVVGPATTGVVAGLTALGAVLGGGISLGSGTFDKSGYKGSSVDSLPEPTASYFTPQAEAKIRQWLDKQSGSTGYKETLYIAASTWSLVYTDLSASNSNYDLNYRVIFYKRPEGGNMFSAFVTAECSPAVKTAPLSEWQANNYQKVTQETQKMMDSCLPVLESQLPHLLKK